MATIATAAFRNRSQLSRRSSFVLQASILVMLLAASAVPTPLYSVFQSEWGFSAITVTVVFGIYALAVLVALLVVGKLSDHIGRRPVLLVALVMQLVALGIFLAAGDVATLIAARVVQGLSTGAAVGALGAGLFDLDNAKGAIANGVAPITGTATGSVVSGVFIQYLPAPTHLIFEALLGIFVVQTIAVVFMPETATPKPGALASLRPRIAVPPQARGAMIAAVPALVAAWSLASFYGGLGPAVIRTLSGSTSYVLAGMSLFALAATGAITVFLVRNVQPHRVMAIGSVALFVGVGIALLAIDADSTAWFFVGSGIAGVGFGAGFQGAIRTVVPFAETHERAGLLSALYVVSYLAFGLPAVIAGVLDEHLGLLRTARWFGLVTMALAMIAFVGLVVQRRAVTRVDRVVMLEQVLKFEAYDGYRYAEAFAAFEAELLVNHSVGARVG
jgi:MFS family permease